jgi:hypothetical protein
VKVDFETLSCQVPTTGSAPAAAAFVAPPTAAAIARTAVISSFLMLVPSSLMLSDRLLLIFEYTAPGSMRAQASNDNTEVCPHADRRDDLRDPV